MNALNRRLKTVERAIRPDCENCPHNRIANLTDAELIEQFNDLRRRELLTTPLDELKEEVKEITESLQRRIASGEENRQQLNHIVESDCS